MRLFLCLRRWPNIKTSLFQGVVFAGLKYRLSGHYMTAEIAAMGIISIITSDVTLPICLYYCIARAMSVLK